MYFKLEPPLDTSDESLSSGTIQYLDPNDLLMRPAKEPTLHSVQETSSVPSKVDMPSTFDSPIGNLWVPGINECVPMPQV